MDKLFNPWTTLSPAPPKFQSCFLLPRVETGGQNKSNPTAWHKAHTFFNFDIWGRGCRPILSSRFEYFVHLRYHTTEWSIYFRMYNEHRPCATSYTPSMPRNESPNHISPPHMPCWSLSATKSLHAVSGALVSLLEAQWRKACQRRLAAFQTCPGLGTTWQNHAEHGNAVALPAVHLCFNAFMFRPL